MHNLTEMLAKSEIVDLSLELAEDLPCSWPGHVPFRHQIGNWFEDRTDLPQPVYATLGRYQTRWMTIDEHTGTHMDAPTHGLRPDDDSSPWSLSSAETIALEQVCGEVAVVEIPGPGEGKRSGSITEAVIQGHERAHGALRPGMVVLLRTGWDVHYLPGDAGQAYASGPLAGTHPGWPALNVQTLVALVKRGITCVGTDAPSIGAVNEGGPVHDFGFRNGLVFLEGMANLGRLPARGAFLVAMPLKLRGGTGSPVRAAAFITKEQTK